MKSGERILEAAYSLISTKPHDKITFADIAKLSNVHWSTVRRYFGSKEKMRKRLLEYQVETNNQSLADTRTKILESAETIFAKYGYEGATLDQVAQNSGLTKGAVYWHFSSKNDLFLALTEKRLKELLTNLNQESKEIFQASLPQEALTVLLNAQFQACELEGSDKPLLLFEFISKSRDPEMKAKLQKSFTNLLNGTSQIINQLQNEEFVTNEITSSSLSITLHALINGVVLMWILSPNSVPISTIAKDVTKVIWDGIRPIK
ncbi:TetR/AcrR family transcriptional regulator [Heyndrickxia oleronia]|uniref:TetR/AcrR family transcriptional regulator n=1 Tax=Heyndrickxia oleronia TaxID=38875 RepID=A0AAW6SRY1_9BACI|nr:TetR/AcrR family transcriptional regulator [Heyndrickxia oleronia]MDH5159586.1 TetR/AcrR family transcriptional regulator [Heyndrickxia oleronia]